MPASDPLLQRLQQTAAAQLLAIRGHVVLVGLSGGADSVALLHILTVLRAQLDLTLHAAHFDHGLRRGSNSEAGALRTWTETLGVSLTGGSADVHQIAREKHWSLEAAAREARYAFFADTARSLDAIVVVAHNQNDQAETVLLNLARGAGITGAAGMRPVTILPSAPDIVLVRPFLSIAAVEVRACCARNELPVLEDPTNHSMDFARNRVRRFVVPALEEVNAKAAENLAHAAEALRGDEEALDRVGAELYARTAEIYESVVFLDVLVLSTAPRAVQLRTLRLAVRHIAGQLEGLERTHLLALIALAGDGGGGRTLHLPAGLRALRCADRLILWIGDFPEQRFYPLPLLEGADSAPARLTAGWIWSVTPGRCSYPTEEPGQPLHEHVRYTEEPLVLRAARAGETFRPLGMPNRKRVADFLADHKVPPFLRKRVPLLTAADEPAWLIGWRIDDRWKLHRRDAPFACLRCTPAAQTDGTSHI